MTRYALAADVTSDLSRAVESPCVGVCTLNKNVCVGCGRTVDEIGAWSTMTDDKRKGVLERIDADWPEDRGEPHIGIGGNNVSI